MELIAHAVFDAVVTEDDGEALMARARDSLLTWLEDPPICAGDHVIVLRDVED